MSEQNWGCLDKMSEVNFSPAETLYGLETVILQQKDVDILNDFHKDMLRRIQHLPQRTALPIVYGLVGQFPIEFELHRRQFILFGNIVREEFIEKDLAFWQLSIKDDNSHSWFIMIKKNLYKFGLPSPYELLENPPAKSAWKRTVNKKLVEYWKEVLVSETQKKSSLQFWNPSSLE